MNNYSLTLSLTLSSSRDENKDTAIIWWREKRVCTQDDGGLFVWGEYLYRSRDSSERDHVFQGRPPLVSLSLSFDVDMLLQILMEHAASSIATIILHNEVAPSWSSSRDIAVGAREPLNILLA